MISVKLLTFYYEQCNRNHFSTSSSVQWFWRTKNERERERKRFVKKMKDKHNSNTKHLIAYSIQLLLSIFFFALSWRSLAMTHAVNTPRSQLISFKVNNSVCKLIIYYKNRIFFDTFDRSNIQQPESVNEVSMPAKKEEVWTLFNFSYRLFTIIQE